MEENDGYFYAYLFLDLDQYASDQSEKRVVAQYSIDDAIDSCLDKFDAIVYEVDSRSFDVIRVLHH